MRGTRSLSDILCELITLRGYGRPFAREILENAWNTAIGEPHCRQTQVGEIHRGVLRVTVAHPSLLEELVAFRKAPILAALQSSDLGTAIHDIQFQVGPVAFDIKNEP
jgi:Dna[CI] antecedent, DciA